MKKKKYSVLVTGLGGDVAQGIVKCLRTSKLDLTIIGTCVYSTSAGLYFCDKGYLTPFVIEGKKYVSRLINICKEEQIDILFPGIDSELLLLSKYKNLIKEKTGTEVYISDYEITKTYCDKYETYKYFKKGNLPYPETILLTNRNKIRPFIEKFKFPLFLKKRFGQSNVDSKIINSFADLHIYIGNNSFVLQEYLPNSDAEFTSGIYIGRDKDIKGICTLRRELKGGTTYRAEVVTDSLIEKEIRNISLKMNIFGYFNIQSRNTEKGPIPFEINPRFSGTTAIINKFSFNGPEMAIEEILNGKILKRITNLKEGYVCRYYDEVYIMPEKLNELIQYKKVINK